MTDLISGQIDLSRLFNSETAQDLINTLSMQGASIARASQVTCVMIGSPHYIDDAAEEASRQ